MKISGEYFVQVKYKRVVELSGGLCIDVYESDIIDFDFDGVGWELPAYIKNALGLGDFVKDVVVLCMVKGD